MNVRIKIGKKAVLISFDTMSEKFSSNYERNKFFRGLYGWNQTVPKEKGCYSYRREGILGKIPHIKVADSAFIVPAQDVQKIMKYFEEWSDKVMCDMMNITLDEMQLGRVKHVTMKKIDIKEG